MSNAIKRVVPPLLAPLSAYMALLAFPFRMFSYEARYRNVTIYSDRPISAAIKPMLQTAEDRSGPNLTHEGAAGE